MSETFDRTPPNDIAAERVVLGAMMLSTDAIADIVDLIKPGDYYRPVHSDIHNALVALYGRGEPTEPVAVAAQLLAAGDLQRAGGAPYLIECASQVPTAANGSWYARRVAELATRRRLMEVGSKISQLAASPEIEVSSAVDQAGAAFYDATAQHDHGDLTPASAETARVLQAVRDAADQGDGMRGIPTGFPALDRLTNGLQPGQLIVLAGRPGMGKSVAAVDICRQNAIREGKKVAYFSLEMSVDELLQRAWSAESDLALNAVKTGRLSGHEWPRLERAARRVHDSGLLIDPSPNVTLTDVRARCRRISQQGGLDLVVVDYLQLMTPSDRRVQNREQEVAEISRGLKLLAKELGVPVIAVAQLNRGPEQRTDKRPQLSDLRESGSLEQDADIVMFVHRDDYYDKKCTNAGEAEFIIAKHRGGATGTVTVASRLPYSYFTDLEAAA